MCLGFTVVMGVSGMSGGWEQTAEWLGESVLGAGVGLAAARWIIPYPWMAQRPALGIAAIAAVVSLPLAVTVSTLTAVVHHVQLTPFNVARVVGSVFATSLVMVALAVLVRRRPTQTHAVGGQPPPKFLARLPAKLAGAELYAVEAEDHYLRLHTSLGQDLILLRLADAIAELEGLEGAQTHRSWWVARAAIASAERMDGRAVLTLKDGAEVPVSRGFARELRAAGWF
jgi:DNA-binding LytR/AlgR family response regulator